ASFCSIPGVSFPFAALRAGKTLPAKTHSLQTCTGTVKPNTRQRSGEVLFSRGRRLRRTLAPARKAPRSRQRRVGGKVAGGAPGLIDWRFLSPSFRGTVGRASFFPHRKLVPVNPAGNRGGTAWGNTIWRSSAAVRAA